MTNDSAPKGQVQIPTDLILKAGRLATAARRLVGGQNLTGYPVPAATVEEVSCVAAELRIALDNYEDAILDLHKSEKADGRG